MNKLNCKNCDGTGWIVYLKDAPSPPYKPNIKFSCGVPCNNCQGVKQ